LKAELKLCSALLFILSSVVASAASGDWPEPRQNAHLTGIQPMPGKMANAPAVAAKLDLGRSAPSLQAVKLPGDKGWIGLAIVAGALQGYDPSGAQKWNCHPAGLNFTKIEACGDFDGDGRAEAAMMAGRSADPFGAAVLVSLDDGNVLWRYDVEPMSYAWYLYVGNYLPGTDQKQIVVLEHAYPPDKDNGYIALFAFDSPGKPPVQRWRYDFSEYTCFPSLLQTDLDGDGKKELVVETHSRAWFLDAETGALKQFVKWDVSPANVRSYGLVDFVDLNSDGREDFLCIANFAQHHEVLLNKDGKMELAWAHGWPESVTTRHVSTSWPEPPYGDIDGDGRMEIVVSMFNSESDDAWLIRVYDAVTGTLKYRQPGMVAAGLDDCDGDGFPEILANVCDDPTETTFKGARLLKLKEGNVQVIWQDDSVRAFKPEHTKRSKEAHFLRGETAFTVERDASGAFKELPWTPPVNEKKNDQPAFANLPAVVGPQPSPELLAVSTPEGMRLLVYLWAKARLFRLQDGALQPAGEFESSALPAVDDLDGDGRPEIITVDARPDALPTVMATTLGPEPKTLWQKHYPATDRVGFPHGRTAYLRTGRFTGKPTPDVYAWTGTPLGRSAMLDGRSGEILWEGGEMKEIERYIAPTINLASVYDYNADGKDDLVFTAPDFYCVADGPTGKLLTGPLFPPKIFNQPSQGLYTFPAILERKDQDPLVALVAGHYFQGVMTIKAEPLWYKLPVVGEARCAQEAFLRTSDGAWLMGFGRQNGNFACVNAADGSLRWELPIDASATDPAVCDIDSDGRPDFLFGTSHGKLYAVSDLNAQPEILWTMNLGPAVGAPIAADLNGDGASEVVVATADGWTYVLSGDSAK
jgi:outer membrane protein assembly factor BamB